LGSKNPSDGFDRGRYNLSSIGVCDVVTINAPLHPQTENLFDDALLSKMKHGAYLVNTARAGAAGRIAGAVGMGAGTRELAPSTIKYSLRIGRPSNLEGSRVMRGMSGFRNPLPTTIHGAPCLIMA
jgi:D-isomer specific 2-hydroxyacid dehydrogenase, NAD binding domain